MKTFYRWTLASVFALAAIGCFGAGCKKNPTASIYDPAAGQSGEPVVTSIVPENAPYVLSGVTTLQVNGSNFTADPSKIVVYFDAQPVPVLSATPTQIRVKAPNFYKDSVKVRVAVVGADKFSQTQYLTIKPSVLNADSIDFTQEEPRSLAVDRNNNLYVSMTSTLGIGAGVFKFSPAGNRQQFAPKGSETFFSSMKVGPGDTIFAARRVAAIYYLDPNIVTASKIYTTKSASPPMNNIEDFDFDSQKILWGGGSNNTGIYRINKFRQAREFPFANPVHAVRVFNGAVYCAATVITAADTAEAVYKFAINPADTSLGAPEVYFTLTAQPDYRFARITAITFDMNGVLYVGTDKAGILAVAGANAPPTQPYAGVVGPNIVTFQWGTGTILYVIQANEGGSKAPQSLLKVDMQVQGAPYYGRE